MGDLLLRAAQTFKRNFGFIIIFCLTNGLTYTMKLANEGKGDFELSYFFTVLLWSFIVGGLIEWLFVPWFSKGLKCFIYCVSLFFFIVEAFVLYQYKAVIGVGVVAAMAETTPQESKEFLSMYLGPEQLWAIFLIVAIVSAFAYYKPWRKVQCDEQSQKVISGITLSVCIGYTICAFSYYPNYMIDDPLTPFTRFANAASKAWENHVAYQELSQHIDTNIELTRNDGDITNIVFIQGESTNRNHMHLYGYDVPNTPNLDDMAATGEISVFRDVVSAHSTTVASLSKIFTFCDRETGGEWYNYHNLIDIMNTAGYKTYWLSNQESSGVWGSVAQIYAAHSAVSEYTQIRDSKEDNGVLDGELFPIIDRAIASRDPNKNFFVVHLMGCHGAYYNRFPYIFTKFKKEDIKAGANDEQKQIIAQYDNAIYYNDYIVSGIIDKFRETKTDSIVIYLPDHGEAVYDEDGFNGHIEENPSRHMIEVPLIIWASESFKKKHPEKWLMIQMAVNRPFMTDDMIHTVMDIAGIVTPDWKPEKSLINPAFDVTRPRIFDDQDYDKDIKNK